MKARAERLIPPAAVPSQWRARADINLLVVDTALGIDREARFVLWGLKHHGKMATKGAVRIHVVDLPPDKSRVFAFSARQDFRFNAKVQLHTYSESATWRSFEADGA